MNSASSMNPFSNKSQLKKGFFQFSILLLLLPMSLAIYDFLTIGIYFPKYVGTYLQIILIPVFYYPVLAYSHKMVKFENPRTAMIFLIGIALFIALFVQTIIFAILNYEPFIYIDLHIFFGVVISITGWIMNNVQGITNRNNEYLGEDTNS